MTATGTIHCAVAQHGSGEWHGRLRDSRRAAHAQARRWAERAEVEAVWVQCVGPDGTTWDEAVEAEGVGA